MIRNLPKQFPIAALEEFEFGDAEAQLDPLLFSCPVPTSAMAEVLSDKKDIVLGYRGTGKSALVRMLSDGKVGFKVEEGWKSIVLCLDEEFSFQLVSSAIRVHATDQRDRKLLCRVVWELLLIYRALQEIKQRFATDATVVTYLAEIEQALGFPIQKPGLIEVLLSSKKKVGIKIDTNFPSIVDMYLGWEPATSAEAGADPVITLRLIDYKKYLNRFLHEQKATLHVLFDRLDDFVAREEYEIQRQLLHGLLATQADYRQKYPRIRVKAFIRSDLFIKLDLSDFGPDKLLARSVSLAWSSADMKWFIAKRIAFNLMKALKLQTLQVEVDSHEYCVTRAELGKLNQVKDSFRSQSIWSLEFWRSLVWLAKLDIKGRSEGRLRNSTDVHHEAVITSILPTIVAHKDSHGEEMTMGIFDYLDTHFQFGHGETTPRAMLSFLNHFLARVQHYYRQNPDIAWVPRNSNGEYPLFVKRAVMEAYEAHRKECWDVQYNWANTWKALMGTAQRLSTSAEFSFEDFVQAAKVSEDEARQFLAFCTHTGLVHCQNERERHDLRRYSFPVLFRTIKTRKNASRPVDPPEQRERHAAVRIGEVPRDEHGK